MVETLASDTIPSTLVLDGHTLYINGDVTLSGGRIHSNVVVRTNINEPTEDTDLIIGGPFNMDGNDIIGPGVLLLKGVIVC